jgi:hypothetical protein
MANELYKTFLANQMYQNTGLLNNFADAGLPPLPPGPPPPPITPPPSQGGIPPDDPNMGPPPPPDMPPPPPPAPTMPGDSGQLPPAVNPTDNPPQTLDPVKVALIQQKLKDLTGGKLELTDDGKLINNGYNPKDIDNLLNGGSPDFLTQNNNNDDDMGGGNPIIGKIEKLTRKVDELKDELDDERYKRRHGIDDDDNDDLDEDAEDGDIPPDILSKLKKTHALADLDDIDKKDTVSTHTKWNHGISKTPGLPDVIGKRKLDIDEEDEGFNNGKPRRKDEDGNDLPDEPDLEDTEMSEYDFTFSLPNYIFRDLLIRKRV